MKIKLLSKLRKEIKESYVLEMEPTHDGRPLYAVYKIIKKDNEIIQKTRKFYSYNKEQAVYQLQRFRDFAFNKESFDLLLDKRNKKLSLL